MIDVWLDTCIDYVDYVGDDWIDQIDDIRENIMPKNKTSVDIQFYDK